MGADESPRLDADMYSLSNLYVAYRKAKAEAFYENTHFHALAFTKFEQDLHKNLQRLQKRLIASQPNWSTDAAFIGDHAYLPKSVDTSAWDAQNDGHFRALDPVDDWEQRFKESGCRAAAALRLVIRPTIEFQVVSSLWILKVGHLFDAAIDPRASFGNRLRRIGSSNRDGRVAVPGLNLTTPGLFAPYFSAYRQWREGGLHAMENAVDRGESILAITMDVESFYHRVAPQFLLRPAFLKSIGLSLAPDELHFTSLLLDSIEAWYRRTPDAVKRPEGAIPVGLSASKIIANVLLAQFDKEVIAKLNPIYYGRYVDDIFLVIKAQDGEHGARRVVTRIAEALDPMIKIRRAANQPDSLSLHLSYADDSQLIFAGRKQKIFALSSAHGADLVHHIRDQIRQQSSEYRLLPVVPSTGVAMASRALLATPSASLQADALRKADVVSVRRLGFSLLLRDIETYASDLKTGSWQKTRREFYELVGRHVITPTGFFDYFGYIPRVFGLMVSCGDLKDAAHLIANLGRVADVLARTTVLGEQESSSSFSLCLEQYARALLEAGISAVTMRGADRLEAGLSRVLRELYILHPQLRVPKNTRALQVLAKQVLLADLGRRPYKEKTIGYRSKARMRGGREFHAGWKLGGSSDSAGFDDSVIVQPL